MVSTSPARDESADVIATVAERLGRDQVFGPPVQSGGATLVPVARLRAGGGVAGLRGHGESRSGAGVVARPTGAFSISPDGKVAWHPAVDVNRIVLGGQIAVAAVLVATLLRRRRR
jgi:uncharacterized spore protein YtfJ